MITDFDSFFEWLMKWEGERLENVPGDKGGVTKYGIDQRSHPDVVIAALTRDRARRIYAQEYGSSIGATLPVPLNWVMFDAEVNMGCLGACRCLQRAIDVDADGVIGPVTRAALQRVEPRATAARLIMERERRYKEIAWTNSTQDRFLPGWLNRVADLKKNLLTTD
ncbi:MAG: hypothetical protein LBK76_04560 [Verrucomicrobiales bacterium]|jgi:lysozyme family protein|nr:hypothetical protein [Verrucomicrobiales bacterium]